MDGSNRPSWLSRLRAISSVLVLALAVALSLWTLLLRFAPDDGSEFERRSDRAGRICAGVQSGTCDSDEYARLKREEALPWLFPGVAAGATGMLLAWPRRGLRLVSVAVVLLSAFVAFRVLPAPPESPVLLARRTLSSWIETQPLEARVTHIDVYQEPRGFTIGIWTQLGRDAESRSIAGELARRVPSVVEAVHVYVIGRWAADLPELAHWAAPGAPPPHQRPHYAEVCC